MDFTAECPEVQSMSSAPSSSNKVIIPNQLKEQVQASLFSTSLQQVRKGNQDFFCFALSFEPILFPLSSRTMFCRSKER